MRKKPELPEVEPVRLHPVFGIRPGIIILSAAVALVLLLLFLLLVLPGLMQDGGYVRFSLNTVDTAVCSEDGRYIGSTEGSVYYLPHGENTFRFSIAGEDAGSITAEIPHRIFFTLFSHKVTEISYEVENSSAIEKAVKERFLSSVAAWSAVTEYDERYHYPPIFSSFARNAAALGFESVSDELLYGAMHITSEEMKNDFLQALEILGQSSVNYTSTVLDALLQALDGNAPEASVRTNEKPTAVREGDFFFYEPMTVTIGNSSASSYPEANERAVDVQTGRFAVAARPVTEYEYALFVEENPYWSRENLAALIADGMADSGYLEDITLTTAVRSSAPIRSISWHAADAYTRWLSEKTGENIIMPTEAEWTAAALSAAEKPYTMSLMAADSDTSSPSFMMGQLWEFTSTPYIPLSRVADYETAISLGERFGCDDIIVKGGSYANMPQDITPDTVGVAGKSATSRFVTLRIGIR